MSGKNVVVLGSGLMGSSIALDLLESNSVSKLTVVDTASEKLKALEERAENKPSSELVPSHVNLKDKLETKVMDITKNEDDVKKFLSGFELGIGALPHGIAEEAVQAAADAKMDFVDLIYSWRYEDGSALDSKAKKNGVTIIPACGLAPGLTNILAKYAADQMEEVDQVKIYV